jgi:hypothetical protein
MSARKKRVENALSLSGLFEWEVEVKFPVEA